MRSAWKGVGCSAAIFSVGFGGVDLGVEFGGERYDSERRWRAVGDRAWCGCQWDSLTTLRSWTELVLISTMAAMTHQSLGSPNSP